MTTTDCAPCFDACDDVCLSGHVARGAIRTTDRTACLASDERLATFRFDLTVNNCSERTINNFMPRLDLNNVFLVDGGAVCSPSRVTSALRVTASIGEANGLYDGTERTTLLCHTVPLPPGCSTFSVYLTDPHLNTAALQSALFSVKGHVKCAPCALDACYKPLAPQCVALHKSVALNCDCLPLETEASARRIVYVRADGADGSGDGASWTTAYRGALGLQQAVSSAVDGDQVWVAEGDYVLSQTLQVASNVKVYGGFRAGDTALCQRRLLEGGGSGSVLDGNAQRRVIEISASVAHDTTTVDGFVVRNGSVQAGLIVDGAGIGIVRNAGEPLPKVNVLLRNLLVANNVAFNEGGGLGIGFPARESDVCAGLCNVTFSGNTAFVGGAIAAQCGSDVVVVNNTFVGNGGARNVRGGAVELLCQQLGIDETATTGTFFNCVFRGNSAGATSGGMMPVPIGAGGALSVATFGAPGRTAAATVVNCTFTENTAAEGGAVLSATSFAPSASTVVIVNSILWNDTATNVPNTDELATLGGTIVVSNSIVGNTTSSPPLIVFAGNVKAQDPRFEPDLHLQHTSPAINCGENGVLRTGTDRANRPRVAKGRVDLGAFELQC